MALGKTLKALRHKQGLNQKVLATLSGVSQATISRIETGRVHQLRSAALKRLADTLKVSVDFLMGDSEVFASIPDDQASASIPGLSEDLFRQIADALEIFFVFQDRRGLYANQVFADQLGYSTEEIFGKDLIELLVARPSRAMARNLMTVDRLSGELLLVRKDGTSFCAELSVQELTDDIGLGIVRDLSGYRRQQAVARVQQIGLETGKLTDLSQIVRVLADELEDMGIPFEAVGINLIEEEADRLTTFYAYPESRGYHSFQDALDLSAALAQHAPLRRLVSHWRRGKVWQRQSDDEFVQMMHQSFAMGPTFNPGLVMDAPFAQGTLSLGLSPGRPVRGPDIAALLDQLANPLSFVVKHLQTLEALLRFQPAGALDESSESVPPGLYTDADVLRLCQLYRDLSAPGRDLVRAFVHKINAQEKQHTSAGI